jgi:hypothetical protein
MSESTAPVVASPRKPWGWAATSLIAGAALAVAVSAIAFPSGYRAPNAASPEASAKPLPAVGGDTASVPADKPRFVAPLDKQADTGELPIALAAVPFRSDTFEIKLASGDEAGHELEQKLRARQGATIVYSWSVKGIANPEEFHADLHGHTPPAPGYREASFRQGGGLADNGAFVAPFEGIHGWLFKNDSAGPAVVKLTVSGFYEPISQEELERITQAVEQLPAA